MRQLISGLVLMTVFFSSFPQVAYSQDVADDRLDQITERIDQLESRIQRSATAVVLFLFAAFCALWAQNTNRNAWLWFFLGWFFHVIAVLVLLAKNSDDRRQARGESPAAGWVILAVIFGIFLVAAAAMWLYISRGG